MNILFLTIIKIDSIYGRGIYHDLMRKFADEGHKVYMVTPTERRYKEKTHLFSEGTSEILKVRTLNLQKTNIIEKGVGTILLNSQYQRAIKQYFDHIDFDLILYSTPPITLTPVITKIKRKFNAKTYLLLKDIFPQNAVDIGLMKKSSILYKYFSGVEKKLYNISDNIGCMSPANVEYLLSHNPQLSDKKIEVNPNSIELSYKYLSDADRLKIRKKYNLPLDSTVFIYGGNLGKPQGLEFLLEVLTANINMDDKYFCIVGSGTEYPKIKTWFDINTPSNAKLIPGLPKDEYDKLVQACDVGMIFLDKRFTIPNYPSRLLSYLEYKKPVIAITDPNTDLGKIAEQQGYGFSILNGDIKKINEILDKLKDNNILQNKMGKIGFDFLINNYTVENSYKIIRKHIKKS